MSGSSIIAAKKQLRTQMRERLGALASDRIAGESERVLRRVSAHPRFQRSTHVSIYLSMAKELQTMRLVERALAAGKSVYVPRCAPGGAMEMVRLAGLDDLAALAPSRWGIPEPPADRAPVDPALLDFVLVPGVAFDACGNRCGHGKGYYDRFLARAVNAFACAACLDEQVVDSVPAADHDRKPDIVVSPSGTVFCAEDKREPLSQPV
ncbi:hypothetical protein GGI11_005873 [Coemansia sp. RSA 2049]|nr:hypothetical protein GGI11_005873 [Coemansia sp. RSA 2049]